jgi:hypothetical protein
VQMGQRAFVVRMVKEARVFLKHAARDPDAVLTLDGLLAVRRNSDAP